MCEVCLQSPCHPRCPNYSSINTHVYCDKCGEMIEVGDEYIENVVAGKFAHYDCFSGLRDFLDWFGGNIKTMEEEDIEYLEE